MAAKSVEKAMCEGCVRAITAANPQPDAGTVVAGGAGALRSDARVSSGT